MASNSVTNRQPKKPPFRLVQPALPLIPGKRPQKAKAVEVETESDVGDSEVAPQALSNGRGDHEQTQPVEVEAGPASPSDLQNGDIEGKEVASVAGQ